MEDKEFKALVENDQKGLEAFGNGLPPDYVPFLRYFPASQKEKLLKEYVDWYYKYLTKLYKEHKDTYKSGSV